jgi:hypothetical protein
MLSEAVCGVKAQPRVRNTGMALWSCNKMERQGEECTAPDREDHAPSGRMCSSEDSFGPPDMLYNRR